MLTHPTLDQLNQLGLLGMAGAFGDMIDADTASLSHAEWLALLLEREISHRHDKRLAARLRYAKLRHQAAVEDVDYRAVRGLDRALFQKLATGAWIDAHDNLILCGPTGVGKSWLASALGHRACRDNSSVLYQRVPKLFAELALARADGRHRRMIRGLVSPQLLILDDWGLEPLDAGGRHDLLEILEDRYGRRSTIVTSQVPVEHWHQPNRRSNLRGRDPGQARPQRYPHRSDRREPASKASHSPVSGLTESDEKEQRETRPQRLRTGRHHHGMLGDIKSERWATSSRNDWATSSEYAP